MNATYRALGDGVASIFDARNENRRRAVDAKKAQDLQGLQFAQAGATPELIEQANKGDLSGIQKLYSENYQESKKLSKDKATREADAAQAGINEKNAKANYYNKKGAKSDENLTYQQKLDMQEATRLKGEARKLEADRKKGLQDASIPDFEIASENIIPTAKDAEEIKKLNASNKTFAEIGDRAVAQVKKLDWKDRTGFTSKYKDLQQSVTEMRLQAKNLADLGVLNGPDLQLVDETLGSVGVTDLNLYGPEEAAKRISSAVQTANQKLQNAASSRGYKPKVAPKKNVDPDDEAAIQWAQKNPKDPRAAQILQLHGVN